MGDTSSGKSSLLSALAQLQLPSNDQITTRCPLRLRMEKSEKKHAQVGIKWDAASTYKDETAWPVVKLDSWDDVATKISQAQALILQRGQVEVAFDVVEVNVYGPECIDLTLIDLPGIVRTVGKNETKRLIDDIKRLIDSYLSNPRCVILAVQPANVDFHNSQILADAHEVDPETRRTIPVITKPDLIDDGAEGGVKKLLLGEEVNFEMGFHMVKCRNQKDLNDSVSMAEGMRKETKFFNSVVPWKDLDKDLFGVVNLRTKLSKLQVRMIKESVPGIIQEIVERRQKVASRLKAVGTLVLSDRERRDYFSQVAKSMTEVVAKTLSGDSAALRQDGVTFLSAEHTRYAQFRNDVMGAKLANLDVIREGGRVNVTTSSGKEESGVVEAIQDNDGKLSYIVFPDTPSLSSLLGPPVAIEYSYSQKREEFFNVNSEYHFITATGNGCRPSTGRLLSPVSATDIAVDTTWLKKLIESNRTNDLPCFLSASVFNSVVADLITQAWTPLCLQLLQDRKDAYVDLVRRAVSSAAVANRFPAFKRFFLLRVEQVVDEIFENCEREVDLSAEVVPYSQNHYLFETILKMRNKRLRSKIMKMVAGKTAGVESIIDAAFSNEDKLSMEDHIAQEMQIVLSAYGKVAAKRVIDNVPMIIQKRTRALQSALDNALQVTDEELKSLIVEDERTVKKVKQDTAEKEKLDIAIKKLEKLHML